MRALDSRTPGLPDSRTPRLPDSRSTRVARRWRAPGLPDSRTHGRLELLDDGVAEALAERDHSFGQKHVDLCEVGERERDQALKEEGIIKIRGGLLS
jgi:hypothetical protein